MKISPEQRLPTALALLALFVALSGTSYAAVKLKKGSVTTTEIKDATILSGDLAPDVAVSGLRGPRGAEGPNGPKGETGPAGPTGPQGVSKVYIAQPDAVAPINTSRTVLATLRVPAGSYRFEFSTHAFSNQGANLVDCDIEVDGAGVVRSAAAIGGGNGTVEGVISAVHATTLPAAATVTASCTQRAPGNDMKVAHVRLLASAVSAVEVQ